MTGLFTDGLPQAWVRDRTLVRVLDDEQREVAVLDGATGLTFVRSAPDAEWELDLSVFPAGRWVFDGLSREAEGDGPINFRAWHAEGTLDEDGPGWAALRDGLLADPVSPWEFPGAPVIFVSYAEREARLSVCRSCPMFRFDGTCKVDGAFMANKSVNGGESCPEGKWGLGAGWSEQEAADRLAASRVAVPVDPEQAAFEAEWEATR